MALIRAQIAKTNIWGREDDGERGESRCGSKQDAVQSVGNAPSLQWRATRVKGTLPQKLYMQKRQVLLQGARGSVELGLEDVIRKSLEQGTERFNLSRAFQLS